MSALITQTLAEKIEVLLIADVSQLTKLVAERIKRQSGVRVVLISWQNFSQNQALLKKDWYKICLLFNHPLDKKNVLDLPQALLEKSIYILPLTTAIKASHELSFSWQNQVRAEVKLVGNLLEKVDISRFIFYKDLAGVNLNPSRFFFSQLERGYLLDPEVELQLQLDVELAEKIGELILKPQQQAGLIEGRTVSSRFYVGKIRELFSRQRQVNLPIKQLTLRRVEHPVLSFMTELEVEMTAGRSEEIVRALVKQANFKASDLRDEVFPSKHTISPIIPPQKQKIVETWNKINKKISFLNFKTLGDEKSEGNLSKQLRVLRGEGEKNEFKKDEIKSKLEFVAKKEVEEEVEKEVEFEDEVSEAKTINDLFSDLRQSQKQEHLEQLAKKTKLGFKKLKNRRWLFRGGVGVSGMALVLIMLMGFFFIETAKKEHDFLAYLELSASAGFVQEKEVAKLKNKIKFLDTWLGTAAQVVPLQVFNKAQQITEISGLLIDLNAQSVQLQQATQQFYQEVMGEDKKTTAFSSLDQVEQVGAQVFKTISLLQAELKNYSLQKLSSEEKQFLEQYLEQLVAREKILSQQQQLIPLFPTILGQQQQKTYAVLVQNSQELRPTGGFIQAVALLTFEQGRLAQVRVEDVYSLDQKLTGIKTPPADLKQYLGEERWFLRDSNWSPDFFITAEQVKWFIDHSLGVKIDGVLGVNSKVLESIVGALGELDLAEYNEVLTKNNLAERIEFHSEVQLVDDGKKRDYMELILFKLIEKLRVLPEEKITEVLAALMEMANDKELLFSAFDSGVQTSFESLGWSGTLIKPSCPTVFGETECVVDVIAQVEANVGVNKANYYLERQIDHRITLLPNKALHRRVITFKNKAQTNAWPKGPYKAYTRFYLPLEAELNEIRLNEQKLEPGQIILSHDLNRLVVGVLTETAVKAETKLELSYALPHQQQTPFTYVFFDQKQPGARDNSPRVFLQHDPDLSPTLIAPQAEVQGEVIIFNPSKDSGHMFVGVTVE